MKNYTVILFVFSFFLGFSQARKQSGQNFEEPLIETSNNNVATQPKLKNGFTDAGSFSEGLAPIMANNGKWGFIDKKGKLVILPKYEYNLFMSFHNGACSVSLNRKLHLIDKSGKDLVPEDYTISGLTGNNFVVISKDRKIGLMDYSGKIIIPVGLYNQIFYVEPLKLFKVYQNRKVGYLDLNGNEVLPPKYTYLDFENMEDPIQATSGNKSGFIDVSGKEIVSFKYDDVSLFSDGFARVRLDDKYGFIDKKGNEIIALKYQRADNFSEDFASVQIQDKWGVINAADEMVIPAVYEEISKFNTGLAIVQQNKKFGVIDKKGRIIIPIDFQSIILCSDLLNKKETKNEKPCFVVEKEGKKGLINSDGKVIAAIKYKEVLNLSSQRTILVLDKKYGLINRNTGKIIVNFNYDFIYPDISENSMYVVNNSKAGFIDLDGKEIIPLQYDSAKNFSEGLAAVTLNSEILFINKKNEIVLKPILAKE